MEQAYEPLMRRIAARYIELLGDNLVGIYLHGSAAFGCFRWQGSDIDFLVVVRHALKQEEKLALLQALVALLPNAPKKGFEMSVVLEQHCRKFVYPTPFELHFSNDWLERYQANALSLCGSEMKTDSDLAAHFTVTRYKGIVVYGEPINRVFAAVPRRDYLDSILLDIENAAEDVHSAPVYIILNLCRVYAAVRDDLVLSKEEGGLWGLENLPERYAPLVKSALSAYQSSGEMETHKEEEQAFCAYTLEQIDALYRG